MEGVPEPPPPSSPHWTKAAEPKAAPAAAKEVIESLSKALAAAAAALGITRGGAAGEVQQLMQGAVGGAFMQLIAEGQSGLFSEDSLGHSDSMHGTDDLDLVSRKKQKVMATLDLQPQSVHGRQQAG
jgi:hypothetical protein